MASTHTVRLKSRVAVEDGPEHVATGTRSTGDLFRETRMAKGGSARSTKPAKQRPKLTEDEKGARNTYVQILSDLEKMEKNYSRNMAPFRKKIKEKEAELIHHMEENGVGCARLVRKMIRDGVESAGEGEPGSDEFEVYVILDKTRTEAKPLLGRQERALDFLRAVTSEPEGGDGAVASEDRAIEIKHGMKVRDTASEIFDEIKQKHDSGLERAKKLHEEKIRREERKRARLIMKALNADDPSAAKRPRSHAEQVKVNKSVQDDIVKMQAAKMMKELCE